MLPRFFFFNDTATTEIYTLSLHDALPIYEVGRQVAAVELHALDDVEFVGQRLAFFNGDHAFLADLVHGFGNDAAHGFVGVGGDRADLGDFLGGGGGLGLLLQLFHQGGDRKSTRLNSSHLVIS